MTPALAVELSQMSVYYRDRIRSLLSAAGESSVLTIDSEQELTDEQKLLLRAKTGAGQSMVAGRTITALDATILATDYGTIVDLGGETLAFGYEQIGGAIGIAGPGSIVTTADSLFSLRTGERAMVMCLGEGDTRVVAATVMSSGKVTVSETPPESPQEGEGWFDSSSGTSYVYYMTGLSTGAWVEQFGGSSYPLPSVVDDDSVLITLTSAIENSYVRLTNSATKRIVVPLVTSEFAPSVGGLFTIRNVGAGDALIETASPNSTLLQVTDAHIIPQHTTGQLVYVGTNIWDVQ
jgi:hypothetical protein